jgi:hypothetical protein
MKRWLALLIAVCVSTVVVMVPLDAEAHRSAQQEPVCFSETSQCIGGRFREYWIQHGGVAVFGYPIGPESSETTPEGTFVVQYFERARFEYHPEHAAPYDVLLGRLGDARLTQQGYDWTDFFRGQRADTCIWFDQTQHSVCEPFKTFWETHGLTGSSVASYERSLALFGMPLSEPLPLVNNAGERLLVQWFERTRFEYRIDDPKPNTMTLGLLGSETLATAAAQPAVDPAQCLGIPATLNADVRPSHCVYEGMIITMDIYGFRPNETIEYWLTAPDGNLDGPEQTFTVGVGGAIIDLEYDTTGTAPGIWTWTFRGQGSDHFSIIPFKVVQRP